MAFAAVRAWLMVGAIKIANIFDQGYSGEKERSIAIIDGCHAGGRSRLQYRLGRPGHLVPLRAVGVGAAVIVVAVDVIDIPLLLDGMANQQILLVLDAFALLLCILILLAQTAINRACHSSYTSR